MRQLSGLRFARSMLSPSNEVLTQELDFQLGAREGIAIIAVLGTVGITNITASTTFASNRYGMQTIHMETGALEDIPINVAEDAYLLDTEVFFTQRWGSHHQSVGGAAGDGGSASDYVTPSGIVTFPEPVICARNLTHRAEAPANVEIVFDILLHFYYVELTLEELGLLLSMRA